VLVLCAEAAPAAIDKLAANISAQAFRDNVMLLLPFAFLILRADQEFVGVKAAPFRNCYDDDAHAC
jgi:hypothetical protein